VPLVFEPDFRRPKVLCHGLVRDLSNVVAGLGPAIHEKDEAHDDVDARRKAGHDVECVT
jgi:hypothetical protein